MSKLIALLLILVALIAAQCDVGPSEVSVYAESQVFNNGEPTVLHRTIDHEAGVVCWWVYSAGFECLLIKDTELDR